MSHVRPVKVLAAGWLMGAAGLTVLVAPLIGWRGWLWLGIFDLLSLLGAGWELWLAPASTGEAQSYPEGPHPSDTPLV